MPLPLPHWINHYQKEDLPGDFIAGLTVAIILIPQGMAYALLAGMPPQFGLYAGSVGAVLYLFFGSSHLIAAGPTATLSILTAATINQVNTDADKTLVAASLALAVGLIFLLASAFRVGRLLRLVNQNIISAFATAAALTIAFSQLHHLMGIEGPTGSRPYQLLLHAIRNIPEIQPTTILLGIAGIIGLLIFRLYVRKWLIGLNFNKRMAVLIARSGPLIIMALGTLIVKGLSLHTEADVAIIGTIPSGLPAVRAPLYDLSLLKDLWAGALTICLIGFLENIAILERVGAKARANRELIALGSINIGVAFLSGFPINASFSRSAVNKMSEARTGLSSIISSVIVFTVLIFFTQYLYYFPKTLLAAIVFVAIGNLINWGAPFRLWRTSRRNMVLWLTTFAATMFFSLAVGVVIGFLASIVLKIMQLMGFEWHFGEWPEYNPSGNLLGKITAFSKSHLNETLRSDR